LAEKAKATNVVVSWRGFPWCLVPQSDVEGKAD